MIVSARHKALLLRLKTPEKLEGLKYRTVRLRGKTFYVVPFTIKTVQHLRKEGLAPPNPIQYYYEWSRNPLSVPKPFHAQIVTAGFLVENHRAFVLNGLGSGKSLASLWAYDYLRSIGRAEKLLVVCPLSTVELTWADAIFEHFPHLDAVVLHASSKAQRVKLLQQKADVYIVNHHGVELLKDELNKRFDIDTVIVDEVSQCARNSQTKMWKALNAVVNAPQMTRTAWGMTATPIPNSPTDVYGQSRLIVPGRVPPYFSKFRDAVMYQRGPYLWLPRDNALETAHDALKPAIRFSREECVDLPPTTYIDVQATLSKDQAKAYRDMLKSLAAQVEAGEITAANEAVKLGKLVQIASGCAYGEDGAELVLPSPDRLAQLEQLVQDSHTKTIVFAPFVSVVKMLHKHLLSQGFTAEMIYGDVSKNQRSDIFHAFQRGTDPQVLVAQPSAMSHGLTLTASSTIVWYAPITSADTYGQANGRITRPGQKHNTLIAHIGATDEEWKIYNRLKRKEKVQNILLDRIRDEKVLTPR